MISADFTGFLDAPRQRQPKGYCRKAKQEPFTSGQAGCFLSAGH
jgi:hypothetical protein